MASRRIPRAVMGGTFDRLHAGHEALLAAAFEHAEEVGIGLTTDEFLRGAGGARKRGEVRAFEARRRDLQDYLDGHFPGRSWYLIPLTDRWGAALEPSVRALVVSDETYPVGVRANQLRRRRRVAPLTLIRVRAVLGEDLLRISSSSIRRGLVDRGGRRLRPLRVGVGSTNIVKRTAVETALRRLFPRVPVQVEAVSPGPPNPQPWGLRKGFEGARRRAHLARGADRDYGVGIEATLLPVEGAELLLDIHAVAVEGSDGSALTGLSCGYPVPSPLEPALEQGRTLEAAVAGLGGPPKVGHTLGGALAYLSGGALSREGLVAQAVEAAFVPRQALRDGRLPATELLPGGKVNAFSTSARARARRRR